MTVPSDRTRGRSTHPAAWAVEVAVWALLLWGVWLLSLSAVGVPELVVGGGCALLSGMCASAARRAIRQRWRPGWAVLAPLGVLPAAIVVDTLAVLLSPLRASTRRGELQTVDVDGAGHTPRQSARRAIVTMIVSATPATVVLDADDAAGSIVVHAMRSPAPSIQERYARAMRASGR